MHQDFYWEQRARHDFEYHLERCRPSIMLRPKLSVDGDQWCALYGDNIQDGVAGFGASPEEAFCSFDENWKKKRK